MIQPLSIYFHWPFCKSKCPYCDFYKVVSKNTDQAKIIRSYIDELDYYHKRVPDRVVRSVFFGGGTPSLIEPEYINKLLDHISALWPMEDQVEISLEANPNTQKQNLFSDLKKAGINRLSLGVQALNEADLKFLGRTHNLKQAMSSIYEVLEIFDNHSMDLIYARPEQTISAWEKELKEASAFGFKHLSLYQLTIEPRTVFARKNIQPLDEEKAADMYQLTVDILRQKSYPRYEVSNFASQPYQSKHNKCYWIGDDYIGIGQSAHGRLKINSAFYEITHPHLMQKLTTRERAEELVLMGLRLEEGISKAKFQALTGLSLETFLNPKRYLQFLQNGYLKNTTDYLSATDKGFLVLDKLSEDLLS